MGGDGFDISWAVNGNGEPVQLDSVKYVRVYTSAALDPNNLTALPTPGIFGETSAEVCGVFVAKESGSGEAAAPTVELGNDIGDIGLTEAENQTVSTWAGLGTDSITVNVSGGTYIYINGVATTSTTVDLSDGSIHNIQIITQSGTASPYVVVLQLSK